MLPSPPSLADLLSSPLPPSRSRRGCWTCRGKKVKCDEERPSCRRCIRLGRRCDYTTRQRKKYTRRASTAAPSGHGPDVVARDDSQSLNDVCCASLEISETAASTNTAPKPNHILFSERRSHGQSPTTERDSTPTYPSVDPPYPPHELLASGLTLSPACVLILSPEDYAAIHCFRFELGAADDTRPGEYAGPALVWQLAVNSPMLLHMVCALGGRRVSYQTSSVPFEEDWSCHSMAAEHYGAALRLLAESTQDLKEESDLDYILGTLWLMIVYEQKYGDGCGVGLIAHLQGAASLLQEWLWNLQSVLDRDESLHSVSQMETAKLQPESKMQLSHVSAFASRVILWIAYIDGGAALNGLGDHFNELLGQAMLTTDKNKLSSRLRSFGALQKRSELAGQEVWGTSYPQSQLLEDLQGSSISSLHAKAGQLRFMLAKLARPIVGADCPGKEELEAHSVTMGSIIQEVEAEYAELLCVASQLEFPMQESHQRFVMHLRSIVSFFHAVVLCFICFSMPRAAPLCARRRKLLREIMTLAYKVHKDEGDQAVARIAWPLFVAVLESDEIVHRIWILERYQALSHLGENFRRAREALRVAFSEQRMDERKVQYLQLLQRNDIEKFVI
ncbi:hypothetical protein BX600DRAFT_530476 [Xylariales sp. PMI_506]|nr:hypothetical protein BX600DRAFT_530476 [Xylariales sp. PMI_506]